MYFAVEGVNYKEVYSVDLTSTGEFAASGGVGNLWTGIPNTEIDQSDLISLAPKFTDIAFSQSDTRMLLAERWDAHKAEVVEFDFSEYHSVCVARYSNEGEAKALKDDVNKTMGIKAYVHKKRKGKGK